MLVENLLLTAQFILSVVFSFLRQAIKMGRFLHNYQFFLTLVEQISRIGNTVQPTLPCWVVPTAGSLSIISPVGIHLFYFLMDNFLSFIQGINQEIFVGS